MFRRFGVAILPVHHRVLDPCKSTVGVMAQQSLRRPRQPTTPFEEDSFRFFASSSTSSSLQTKSDLSTGTSEHLILVTRALEKVLEAKSSPASEEDAKKSHLAEQILKEWQGFENALENAKSCVRDVAQKEAQDNWQEEVATAEQALAEAQAAYLDVLDVLRLEQDADNIDLIKRSEASCLIRQLRQELDLLIQAEQQRIEDESIQQQQQQQQQAS